MNSSVSKYWFLEGFGFDSLFFLRNVVFAGLSSQSHPSGAARTSSGFHLQRNSGKIGKDNDNNYTDFIIVILILILIVILLLLIIIIIMTVITNP